jgi:hypothetical protein
MYNEEQKERFIKSREDYVIIQDNFYVNIFNRVEKYEENLGRDLSNFSFFEIEAYYKLRNSSSRYALATINSVFANYTTWCLNQGLVTDGQNHYLEFHAKDFDKYLNPILLDKRIITRDELEDMILEIPNPRDQFLLLGTFEGLKGKGFMDIATAKMEDISEKGGQHFISLKSERIIEMSKDLYYLAQESREEEKYYSLSGKQKKVVPIIDDGTIMKRNGNSVLETDDSSARNAKASFNRVKQYLGNKYLTTTNLMISGKIDFIRKKSEEMGVSTNQFMSDNVEMISNQFGTRFVKANFERTYKEYL